MNIPDREEFLRGCEQFENREKRDAMYKVATFLIKQFWGQASEMADGLGVLLLTWNQAFYRYLLVARKTGRKALSPLQKLCIY